MKKILSIFFNIDRAYLTGLTIDKDGATLDYINSSFHHVDLASINSDESKNGVAELTKFFYEMDFEPDEISITLPSESVLVTKFPGRSNMNDEQLAQLVNLEIRQIFPQHDSSDFSTFVVPMIPKNEKLGQMMAVIVPNEDFKIIEDLVQTLNKPIMKFEITQLNAHNSFLFNYPEMASRTAMFVSVQGQFMDISVLDEGKPVYYNLIALQELSQSGSLLEKEYGKIVPDYVDSIDACYFFGTDLNKSTNLQLWETASLLGIFEAKRLNAFRMINTNLSQRERDYCARTMHIFPACIGACLPSQHKVIKI